MGILNNGKADMSSDINQGITIWQAVKHTPANLAALMLVGAMILPGLGWLLWGHSVADFATGAVGGCVIAIALRAVFVALQSKK